MTSPSMPDLKGVIALVTGASRGIGKGTAIALGRCGASVYITGRTLSEATAGSLEETAERFEQLPGDCRPIQCDHLDDQQTESVFRQIGTEQGRLDLLCNNAWGGYENMVEGGEFTWARPFWQQPLWRWASMFDAGTRAGFVCSRHAALLMLDQESGLIVNVSSWGAQKYSGNVIYGASKAATDRLTIDMAVELKDKGVTVVSVYPGLVRTEKVLASGAFDDLGNSESTEFIGIAISHLYGLADRHARTGQVLIAAELARELDFTDVDGKKPTPLTIDDV